MRRWKGGDFGEEQKSRPLDLPLQTFPSPSPLILISTGHQQPRLADVLEFDPVGRGKFGGEYPDFVDGVTRTRPRAVGDGVGVEAALFVLGEAEGEAVAAA